MPPRIPIHSEVREIRKGPLGMLLALGGTGARRHRVLLAHIRAFLCLAVILFTGEVVDFGTEIDPNHRIRWTLGFRLSVVSKLISTSDAGSWCGGLSSSLRGGRWSSRCGGFWSRWRRRGGFRRRSRCRRSVGRLAFFNVGLFRYFGGLIGFLVSASLGDALLGGFGGSRCRQGRGKHRGQSDH
jgi:hypothetical protein